MTTISVALCTYNGARYIEEQLLSILRQELPPHEIIVSDDGSTDGTLDIVRRVHAEHGAGVELRVLQGPGRGVTANFEHAVRACAGELIALSDQDDGWHADRLETAVRAIEAEPEVMLQHSDARLVDADGVPLGVGLLEALWVSADERRAIRSGRAFDAYVRRNLATGATVLFRRALLHDALPFPSEWLHDEWLATLAAATGGVQLLDEQLIDYRQHGANQIGARKPTLRYRIGRMLEPRGERYVTLAARASVLVERLEHLGAPAVVIAVARERAAFDRVRAQLPASRVRRIPIVLREYRAGHYAALSSQGTLDVARDLLQPA